MMLKMKVYVSKKKDPKLSVMASKLMMKQMMKKMYILMDISTKSKINVPIQYDNLLHPMTFREYLNFSSLSMTGMPAKFVITKMYAINPKIPKKKANCNKKLWIIMILFQKEKSNSLLKTMIYII